MCVYMRLLGEFVCLECTVRMCAGYCVCSECVHKVQ